MIDDDAIDALVRAHYADAAPVGSPPVKRRWPRMLPEIVLAVAVGLVAVSGGLWWTGALGDGQAREVTVPEQAEGAIEGAQSVPARMEEDEAEARRKVRQAERAAALEAVIGTRPDPEVRWLQGSDSVLDGPDVVLVHVEPWCPHCEPGLEAVLDAAEGTGVVVVALSALTRGSTQGDFEALLEAVDHDGPAGIIAPDDVDSTFGAEATPASVQLQDGEVVWAGHPKQVEL